MVPKLHDNPPLNLRMRELVRDEVEEEEGRRKERIEGEYQITGHNCLRLLGPS